MELIRYMLDQSVHYEQNRSRENASDYALMELMKSDFPPMNPDIANGLAVKHIPYAEKYVDDIIRISAEGYPPEFKYLGCQRCTPIEEFNEVTRNKNNKQSFDIAVSYLYMVKYFFEYKGVRLPPRYIYLPFVTDAGIMMLSNSRYMISPVLMDRIISLDANSVFIRVSRDKLTFNRLQNDIKINGVREPVQVAWATIYHRRKTTRTEIGVTAKCSLMHYLCGRYGFTTTFEVFGKCTPIVGEEEINEQTYPPEEWVICQRATDLKPKTGQKGIYTPTNIRLAIRKEQFTPMVRSMVGGFYYVVTHFPGRLILDHDPRNDKLQYLDSPRQWKMLLGKILFSDLVSEGKLVDDITEHYTSLNEYVDAKVRMDMSDVGHPCETIYDMFALVIGSMDDWMVESSAKVSSMYNKELNILYNVLFDLRSAIFTFYFKIISATKKNPSEKEIVNLMNTHLRTGAIYGIVKQKAYASTFSYSGDNKLPKVTTTLVPQSKVSDNNQGGKSSKSPITDPASQLHVSVIEIGNYLNLPKSDPSGIARINPHVAIGNKGEVLRSQKFAPLLDSIQEIIKRK
jgi:hypothetical protein